MDWMTLSMAYFTETDCVTVAMPPSLRDHISYMSPWTTSIYLPTGLENPLYKDLHSLLTLFIQKDIVWFDIPAKEVRGNRHSYILHYIQKLLISCTLRSIK